ncbi:MAG: ribosome-associated translation inhibitor RaiA [Acidobacteriota bacterium]|nr:MAG: ribosome-associated translation inhibitor RaiA [Acidobacteriota bacterium]
MTIEITGRHLDLTPATRAYAEEKIRKLGRLVDALEIQVTLEAEKHRYTCTIVSRGHGATHTGEITSPDLFASINEAVDVLARQLRKSKTSRLAARREGAATIRHLEETDGNTAGGEHA